MKTRCLSLLLFLPALVACHKPAALIQSPVRLADISRMLEIQKKLTVNSQLPIWNIFNQPMTSDEKQALEFLYAYMPLSDLADYPPSFFLAGVKQSLKARMEMPWSKKVPEDIFLHYVLPLRVNNENLDSFRIKMYNEIRTRIRGLDMASAALEINHWCHEKVTYRGTDSRTSAPLSTIKKSFGRCGEETTFTVSALRTAGIPARQVYTPRWAHVDDNHAWVEVWIEGRWKYLGACEPEPDLNMGWFSEPSRRAVLVHTRAYGRYFGNEEVITEADRFSELNLTAGYAPVKKLTVQVLDRGGNPVDSARVAFGLYNYAEFYPVAVKFSNNEGIASLSAGLGELWIWASRGNLFDDRMISVAGTDTLVLSLNKTGVSPHTEMYDLVPPHAVKVNTTVNETRRRENNRRLVLEDSIRNSWMATFKDSAWSASLATRLHLNRDTVVQIIKKSYGNWQEISGYLEKNTPAYRSTILALAMQVSDKDFSDVTEAVLTDHLRNIPSRAGMDRQIYEKWLISPRIDNEILSPWRSFLKAKISGFAGSAAEKISSLTSWINTNISLDDNANLHSRAPLTPVGVYNIRVADHLSRDIFFVAACRSLGIPARINSVTRITEYSDKGKWFQASMDRMSSPQPVLGYLVFSKNTNPVIPQYYMHFTLAKLTDGIYNTLEFDEGRKLSEFPSPLPLDTGQYLLVTGNRLENGTVLNSMTYLKIGKGRWSQIPVSIRALPGEIKPSGKLNLDELQLSVPGHNVPENLSSLGSGNKLVIIIIDPDKEPTKHVLDELGSYSDHFNQWKGRFLFVMSSNKISQAGILKFFTLPKENLHGADVDNNILASLEAQYGAGLRDKLPLVVLCSNDGQVYYFSAGYHIGVGEQLLKLTQ
jgi:hypothetical protein